MPVITTSTDDNSVDSMPGQDIEKLTQFLTSLYKKDVVEKPKNFVRGNSIQSHIKLMEKYFETIGITDEMGKICLLLESVDQYTKDELVFEEDYDENHKSYEWHKKRLSKLLPDRSNKTLILSDLLKIKQNGSSFSDYVLRIKSEILKAKDDIERSERNLIAVKIFVGGLDDHFLAQAVKLQNPKNLDSAFNCVKALKQKNEEQAKGVTVAQLQVTPSEIQDLQKQISYLTQVVLSLKSSMANLQQHKGNDFNRDRKRNSDKFCKFCRKTGHDIENCFQRQKGQPQRQITCDKCGRKGHIARNCYAQPKRVAQVQETFSDDFVSEESSQGLQEQSGSNDSQVCQITEDRWTFVKPKTTRTKRMNVWERRNNYPANIERDFDYITGKVHCNSSGRTKHQAALTVFRNDAISKCNNKPLIDGKINERPCKVLLDSGSEVNVIDKNFLFNKLKADKSSLKAPNKSIRCANGSIMRHDGTISLQTSLGVHRGKAPFIVAPNISPPVILGIRSMKSMGCELNLGKSCAVVQGVELPFVGKIFPQSRVTSKNYRALQYGTGLQKAAK